MCNDPRISGDQPQDYTRELYKADLCTNYADYKLMEEYVLMLRKKIAVMQIKCGNKCKE